MCLQSEQFRTNEHNNEQIDLEQKESRLQFRFTEDYVQRQRYYLFLTVGVKGKHGHRAVGRAASSSRWHDVITGLVWTRQAQGLVGMFIC